MKKSLIKVSLIFLLFLFTGCERKNSDINSDNKSIPVTKDEEIVVEIFEDEISNETLEPEEVTQETYSEKENNDESLTAENGNNEPLEIFLDSNLKYSEFSAINEGHAVLYKAESNRKEKTVAVNAGHGTKGGEKVKTYSHPDKSPKVTGGTNAKGAVKSIAVSSGMTFRDGVREADITFKTACILKEKLLLNGYDVLMLRDSEDTQLDNIARTVIANNNANCHVALHWDGDELNYDKGCFYISTPDSLKNMEPVKLLWQEHERLGESLVKGLEKEGFLIYSNGFLDIDLTQTSYSEIPSVDIELGNQNAKHDDETLSKIADGLLKGIEAFFVNVVSQ